MAIGKSASIRETLLLPYIAGRHVLDIGSVGQTESYNLWLWLKVQSASLTGIDVLPSADPDVVEGNMEEYQFGRQFDVVVAGDVVEHLANPGRFLSNVRAHLQPGGKLLITTPNAKWWTVMFKPNPTHTLWHDRHTLKYVLAGHGFHVERLIYYPGNKNYPWWLRQFLRHQALFVVAVPA